MITTFKTGFFAALLIGISFSIVAPPISHAQDLDGKCFVWLHQDFRTGLAESSGMKLIDFAQSAYQRMRSMAPTGGTPLADLEQIVHGTKMADLKSLEEKAVLLQTLNLNGNDPVAKGNGPHILEVVETIEHHRESIRAIALNVKTTWSEAELEHIFQFMKTLAAVHDLGKTFPDELVLQAAQKAADAGGIPFVVGRIALHEISSAVYIESLGKSMNIDALTTGLLIRNILGHNEGSGLQNIWWNSFGHRADLLGAYPMPETLPAKILTLADRGGQATLGATGGAQKISLQRLANEKWGVEHLRQSLELNAENTMKQMNEITKNMGFGIEKTEMAKDLLHKQAEAITAFRAIEWDADQVNGALYGRRFSNHQEFFEIVNSTR